MTLQQLRDWHREQMFEAAEARDWCIRCTTQGKRGGIADRASIKAIARFNDMVHLHHDAMVALDEIRDMLDSSSRP